MTHKAPRRYLRGLKSTKDLTKYGQKLKSHNVGQIGDPTSVSQNTQKMPPNKENTLTKIVLEPVFWSRNLSLKLEANRFKARKSGWHMRKREIKEPEHLGG